MQTPVKTICPGMSFSNNKCKQTPSHSAVFCKTTFYVSLQESNVKYKINKKTNTHKRRFKIEMTPSFNNTCNSKRSKIMSHFLGNEKYLWVWEVFIWRRAACWIYFDSFTRRSTWQFLLLSFSLEAWELEICSLHMKTWDFHKKHSDPKTTKQEGKVIGIMRTSNTELNCTWHNIFIMQIEDSESQNLSIFRCCNTRLKKK